MFNGKCEKASATGHYSHKHQLHEGQTISKEARKDRYQLGGHLATQSVSLLETQNTDI